MAGRGGTVEPSGIVGGGGLRCVAPPFCEIIGSCKRCGVEPWNYVRAMLVAVATHPASRIEKLLPDRCPRAPDTVPR